MLVVVTLLCIGPGGYVAFEQRKAREQKEAVEALEKLGGRIEYDSSLPSRSTWQRLLLGDDSFANATGLDLSNTRASDADLAHVRHLSQLRWLAVSWTEVTDSGLASLDGLAQLRNLNLGETQVTNAGLVHVQGLRQLSVLSVQQTQVTDSGVRQVQKTLPKLHINH